MKANELRIGNLILHEGQAKEIRSVWHHKPNNNNSKPTIGISVPKKGESDRALMLKDIKPILLTEKWILEFGFIEELSQNKRNRWLSKHCISYNCQLNRVELPVFGSPRLIVPEKITYVHELQNLYFALTKKELILKQE